MLAQLSSTLLSRDEITEDVFRLTLSSSHVSGKAKPGNFVHLKVNSDSDDSPLLRRPFSIHSVDRAGKSFDILLKVVGRGSTILSGKSPGEKLDLLGPIGNSFTHPPRGKEPVLVAGGMGIVPLWFLYKRLAKRPSSENMTFFLGAKSKNELLYVEELRSTRAELILSTDDGSVGRKGLVTEVFLREVKRRGRDRKRLAVYSCGPHKMLKRISGIAKSLDLWCQVSLETHMACGIGACWGCVVKGKDGQYKRVCVDGPVFDAREIVLK